MMNKWHKILIILLIFSTPVFSQLTLHITSVPGDTPPGDLIYVAGNFNNWDPGNVGYQMINDGGGQYHLTFSPAVGALEFKFTRGSWATVEGNASGQFRPNRMLNYPGGLMTQNMVIEGWEGLSGQHTASPQVHIVSDDFAIPELNTTRRVWIYLPPDYNQSTNTYPVFYLQDGQNLFDKFYSFSGEWKIDETMDSLYNIDMKSTIVVGIDNGGSDRIDEYSPWVNASYGGGKGELYAQFLVNTLKPYIDSHYRTKPGREFNGIGGSSMGALISFYTGLEYDEVFSKIGVFSPSFWFSDSTYAFANQFEKNFPMKIYFVAGENESASMVPDMLRMKNLLTDKGFESNEIKYVTLPGSHNEALWSYTYPAAYVWLFSDAWTANHFQKKNEVSIYPNPAQGRFKIQSYTPPGMVRLINMYGQTFTLYSISQGEYDISSLVSGIYIVTAIRSDESTFSLPLIIY